MTLLEKIQSTIDYLEGEDLTPCSLHLSGADENEFYKLLRNMNPDIYVIDSYLGLTLSCYNSSYSHIIVEEESRKFDINNSNEEII